MYRQTDADATHFNFKQGEYVGFAILGLPHNKDFRQEWCKILLQEIKIKLQG